MVTSYTGGFNVHAILTNNSAGTWGTWSLAFVFTADERINGLWGATMVQQDQAVQLSNLPWNGNVEPGGQRDIGFNATVTGTTTTPTTVTINGIVCTVVA
jgi:cellulase/cellobiase CelA1